ncbi:hypothetical protein FKM82_009117 [Ascaphus truei]
MTQYDPSSRSSQIFSSLEVLRQRRPSNRHCQKIWVTLASKIVLQHIFLNRNNLAHSHYAEPHLYEEAYTVRGYWDREISRL